MSSSCPVSGTIRRSRHPKTCWRRCAPSWCASRSNPRRSSSSIAQNPLTEHPLDRRVLVAPERELEERVELGGIELSLEGVEEPLEREPVSIDVGRSHHPGGVERVEVPFGAVEADVAAAVLFAAVAGHR